MKHLTSHLAQQLFVPQVTLSTLVECIVTVRSHCDQVCIQVLDNNPVFSKVIDIFRYIAYVYYMREF